MNMEERMKIFRKIDAHSHIGVFGGWCNCRITAEELIADMDEYNVELALISTYPQKLGMDACDKYAQRLLGCLWVNPNEGTAAVTAQIREAVANHNFKAVKLHPLSHGFLPNDACVFPIAELCIELNVPLMIHTGHPPFSLPWSVGQLAELYPQLPICQIHMGHGNGMYVQSAIDMAKKYPNLYLETSGMPMHGKIKEAYETVGADRIMWGLDAPFHHPTVEMQRTIVSGLTDSQLEDVFYNNAKKFLQL